MQEHVGFKYFVISLDHHGSCLYHTEYCDVVNLWCEKYSFETNTTHNRIYLCNENIF